MRNLKVVLLAGLLAIPVFAASVLAAADPVLLVRDGYVRGLPPGVANTAAYMTLVNRSDEDLVLTGAATPAAESVMLHNTVRRDGQMAMEHVMAVTVPARGSVALKSGGLHLMLMGLKSPLREGQNVRLTLQFQGGFVHSVDLPVISVLNE